MSRQRIDWNAPGLREQLGIESDGVIAQQLGCSRERVRQVRESLGIASMQATRIARIEAEHPELVPSLGTDTDLALAREFGVTAQVVQKLREREGVHRLAAPCGTRTRYNAGCRCDVCRRENADQMNVWRAKNPAKWQANRDRHIKKVLDSAPHEIGSSSYYYYGCRCAACKKASAAYARACYAARVHPT